MSKNLIAIVGTVGVPAAYGGFETLAENLVRYHNENGLPSELIVYCSSKSYSVKTTTYRSAKLVYINVPANGIASVMYDGLSLLHAVRCGCQDIILLGVSGAIFIPFIKRTSTVRVITNIDGIEWRRTKWNWLASLFLRVSEALAVRFSDEIVADNTAISEYVRKQYRRECHVIAYGGDHATTVSAVRGVVPALPSNYALGICRIEPENNISVILEAFAAQRDIELVLIGNWNNSRYGRALRSRYSAMRRIHMLDPIYDTGLLRIIRERAAVYVHGHSAGGTNPSLVEAMHFGIPIIAYDCNFNRYTTEDKAKYFRSSDDLSSALGAIGQGEAKDLGTRMIEIAARRYTWNIVAKSYFDLVRRPT